jgi:putative ABC transport system substrate-binding protein
MKRREFIATLITFAGSPSVSAQPRASLRRIGFLHPGQNEATDERLTAIHEGLTNSEDGVRGIMFEVIPRFGEGDPNRLRAAAAGLIAVSVDALCAAGPAAVRAAREATASVPIVALDLESDPVASGLIASLARPGGNLTGIFLDGPEFSAKCLQLLREALPMMSRVGVLWDPSTGSTPLRAVQDAAAALSLALAVFEVRSLSEMASAFEVAARAKVDGALLLSSPLFGGNPQRAAELASRHRLAAITLFPEFARRGGLLAYGPDIQALYAQAGAFTRKILLGANPADTPVQRPTRFVLVANVRTAKSLAISLPTSVLLRADEVIE